MPANRSLVLKLSNQQIASLVEARIGDEDDVVRHPLGFVRVRLFAENSDMPDLCVHIWPAGLKLNDGNDRHAHQFHMRSKILIGALTDITYADEEVVAEQLDAAKSLEGELLKRYSVHYAGEHDPHVMKFAKTWAHLVELERRELHAGMHYTIPRGVFHRTELREDELTVTLMDSWARDSKIHRDVLCVSSCANEFVYEPKCVSWDEAFGLMREVAERLRLMI